MANLTAYGRCAARALDTEAAILVVGIVPFAPNLDAERPDLVAAFARELADRARAAGKALAFAVDAGPDYDGYRAALAASGAPVFQRVEEALVGLRALA
jgi:sugar phosphate isomerase/epimerase